LRFAACSGGRRYADHRSIGSRLAVAVEIVNAAALRQQKINPLRAVERTSAAQANDRIHALPDGIGATGLDHVGVGVGAKVAELESLDAGFFE
jgi:hypothetical protein